MSTATKYLSTSTHPKNRDSTTAKKAVTRWPYFLIAIMLVLIAFFIRLVTSLSENESTQIKVALPNAPTPVATQTTAPTAIIAEKNIPAVNDANAPIPNEELAQPGDDSAFLKDDAEADVSTTP